MPQAVIPIIVNAVITTAVSAVIRRVFAKKPKSSTGMDRGIELSRKLDPDHPREVGVGEFATGGSGAYECTSGEKNKFLYRATCLSDEEVTGFVGLGLDGSKVTVSGDPFTGYRAVTSHFLSKDGRPRVWLRIMNGAPGQALDTELLAASNGELRSSDRFTGCAVAILKFQYDEDAFQGGEPSARFFLHGAPVYDPDDPASNVNDPSTWSRTSSARFNAALVTAQVMRGWKKMAKL